MHITRHLLSLPLHWAPAALLAASLATPLQAARPESPPDKVSERAAAAHDDPPSVAPDVGGPTGNAMPAKPLAPRAHKHHDRSVGPAAMPAVATKPQGVVQRLRSDSEKAARLRRQ